MCAVYIAEQNLQISSSYV